MPGQKVGFGTFKKKEDVNHTYCTEKGALSKTNKLSRASRNNPHKVPAQLIQILLDYGHLYTVPGARYSIDFWPSLKKNNKVWSNCQLNLERTV